jgi:hypothetical protein
LTFMDNAYGSPQTVVLEGTGSYVSAGIKCPHFRWFRSQKVRWFGCRRARPQRRLRRSEGVACVQGVPTAAS